MDNLYKTKTAFFYYITFIILIILSIVIITLFSIYTSRNKLFKNQLINKIFYYSIISLLIFGFIILFVIWIKKFKKYTHEHRYIDIHEIKGQLPLLDEIFERCKNQDELESKGSKLFHNFYKQWINVSKMPQYKNYSLIQLRKIKNKLYDKYLNEIEELKKDCKKIYSPLADRINDYYDDDPYW